MKTWKPVHALAGLFWINVVAFGWADMLGKIPPGLAGLYLAIFGVLAMVTGALAYEKRGAEGGKK